MSVFAKNLAALEKKDPELAARMRAYRPAPGYRRVPSGSGQADLVLPVEGGETLAYGVHDPLAEARAYWGRTHLRNPVMTVFLGLDLGYRLFAYLERPNPNTRVYLLVEKDPEIFYHLLHIADLTPLLAKKDVYLLVGVPEDRLFLTLRALLLPDVLYTLVKATAVESGSASYRLHREYYKAVLVAFRDAVQDLMVLAGNAPQDSFIGVRNMLLNVPTIAAEAGLSDLFGSMKGRPAVVVATGPSLDKNFRLLREIQDRAVILTVDASLKFLLRNGIRPHFVTCLERVPQTVPFFADLDPEACRDTVQVAVPVVVPDVYSLYPGPKALMYRPFAHFEWLRNDKGTLPVGQSSANMAFKIAEALGCDPIILVGQDLAYAGDGTTHSSAAYWGKTADHIRPGRVDTFRVKGNVQEWVLTNRTWEMFRTFYVRDVAAYSGTVINATEGGAYIDRTVVMPLRDAIDRHVGEVFPVARTIREGLRRPSSADAEAYLAWLRHERIPETLACLEEKRRELEEIARGLADALDPGDTDGMALQVGRSLKYCEALFQRGLLYFAAAQVAQPCFVQAMIEHNDIPNRYHHVDEIQRGRAHLHGKLAKDLLRIFDRLCDLYRDPERTLP